ncbi:hypothetical protein QUB37_03800 [Microcoleus sp. AT3-A2]
MANYQRDISVTNALTGQVIKILRVSSPTPISKSDAIHAVIRHEDRGGKN